MAEAEELVGKSIERLPFTFAFPVKRFFSSLRKEEYGRAMNHMLDFFEISVLWLSALLLKRLMDRHDGIAEPGSGLHRIIKTIDTKRPLSFGDSLNSIFIPLVNLAKTEMKDDPLVRSTVLHLMRKNTCILLGGKNEPSVVQIRNEYKGHSTTLSEELYRNVVYTLEPRMTAFLRALEPLAESQAYSYKDGMRTCHNGADEHAPEECGLPLENEHYYLQTEEGTTDLYPLVFCDSQRFVYIFQTLKEENISYVSSNENALTTIDDTRNEAFDRLFQRTVPSFDISREINWVQICELACTESRRILARAYREKKYNRELFVDRVLLSDSLRRFYDDPDKTIFPMLGEAGQGKTNQLCYWVETLLEKDMGVLFLQSSDFASVTLESHLKTVFNASPRKNIRAIIDSIHERAVQAGRFLYIFFDAINECLFYFGNGEQSGPLGLYNDIARLFADKKYTNFKILFTCRSYTWKHLLSRESERHREFIFRDGSDEAIVIHGFSAEELGRAYAVYRELYQMDTDFAKLSPTARIRMKDPLVLKIACTNYLGRSLPDEAQSYTSVSLFERMFNDIASSYAGRRQRQIIEHLGTYILNRYEQGEPADNVTENLLTEAYDNPSSPLHRLARLIYKQDGISVAYGELINKPERPILRVVENASGGESQIQFIYERFLEYIMGRLFVERECAGLPEEEPIPAKTYIACLHKAATNAVYMGAMRNAMAIDILRTHNCATLIELARDYNDDYDAMLLTNELCNVLIRENYEDDLFALIRRLLSPQIEGEEHIIREFNETIRLIESNKADTAVIARHRELNARLMPVIRLHKLAVVNTINGIFLTDYFNSDLYGHDPYELLWLLMNDPITEISNDACMYTYYLSNRRRTTDYTLLEENLTEKIIHEMYRIICSEPLLRTYSTGWRRKRMMKLIETAVRLTTLLIIDTSLSGGDERNGKIAKLMADLRNLFSYITIDGRLIRIVMPFLQIVLRKQITFQSDYVNNAMEYQGFWQEDVVPRHEEDGSWSRGRLEKLLPLINYSTASDQERAVCAPLLEELQSALLAAYRSGDSFSYFILERIIVITGVREWEKLRPVILRILSDEYRTGEWFDYSQMSLLYSLYQISIYGEFNREIVELYARNAEDWTRRCVGSYRARNSHRANARGLYKRNVMSWYSVVYCTHIGDGNVLDGDECCVPLFYRLIDESVRNGDSRLLLHLIENISEMITDWGYIRTALQLLLHIMKLLDSDEKVARMDAADGEQGIVTVIGRVLSTAKNYFPDIIDTFIKQDLVDLKFPGVATYKEEILSYNPSGESLSDLLTHKFGNFLMWSLLHEKAVSDFAYRAISAAIDKKDCFAWYDHTIRILFRDMFGIKFNGI